MLTGFEKCPSSLDGAISLLCADIIRSYRADPLQRGAILIAPSSRITSPFSISFSMM
jgi:hypothetical protein